MEETDNVGEDTVGLINNSAISKANPSMSVQSPDLIPLPETLTLVQQYPPEVVCYLHFFLKLNFIICHKTKHRLKYILIAKSFSLYLSRTNCYCAVHMGCKKTCQIYNQINHFCLIKTCWMLLKSQMYLQW